MGSKSGESGQHKDPCSKDFASRASHSSTWRHFSLRQVLADVNTGLLRHAQCDCTPVHFASERSGHR